ncbi:MAG TPA: hypothetical protein VGI39_27880 [Polyangiaceae bacterium]|jgi:uncharacterized protein YwbE
MVTHDAQELVRELITGTDALSRAWYQAHDETGSGQLAALRSTLQRIERRLGRDAPTFAVEGELDLVYQRLRDLASRAEQHPEGHELTQLVNRAASWRTHSATRPTGMKARATSGQAGRPEARETPERHSHGQSAPTALWTLGIAAALAALAFSVTMTVRFVRAAL